jgi:uncharacterized protein YjaG (DUF416 family)
MTTKKPLVELVDWKQIAYGAALVERMYPNFALFSELAATDGQAVFRNILNLVWESVSGKNSSIDFHKQLDKLEQITPDPQRFDMYGVWPALDASVGLSSLLSCCLRCEATEILSIATLSQATIENYLQAVGDSEDESLFQADQEYQQQVLQLLGDEVNRPRNELLKSIKALVAAWDVSNIGLSLS